MPEPLLPDLPPALEAFVLSLYSEPELARRALLAPWPMLQFRSAYEERALWVTNASPGTQDMDRRASFERMLQEEREPFQHVDQPYFVGPFTSGTLRSPYPELSDSDFWCFVTLYGTEQATRHALENSLVPSLSGKTTLEYLRAAKQPPGFLASILARFSPPKQTEPRATAWFSQTDILYPNYQ